MTNHDCFGHSCKTPGCDYQASKKAAATLLESAVGKDGVVSITLAANLIPMVPEWANFNIKIKRKP